VTRRLVLTILGVTLAALALAGVGTLALARLGANNATESRLRKQSERIIVGLKAAQQLRPGTFGANGEELRLNSVVRVVFRVDGVSTIIVNGAGNTVDNLPKGVELSDVQNAASREGTAVTGHRGSVYFAAAALTLTGNRHAVFVLTSGVDAGLGPAARWFVWAALVAVLLSALAAVALSRRLVGPLRAVEGTANAIAGGDLSARAPDDDPDELGQLARAVNQMASSLERSKAVEEQFLMSISHDLRTPLTSIRGYAEAIGDGAVDDPTRAAAVIVAEAGRLERLVRDLLELAKLRSTGFSLELADVDLSDVARITGSGQQPRAQAAGVEVAIDAPAAALVRGDADRLGQVVANLVENATKFARSRVTVTVRREAAHVTMFVEDDGPGIAPEDLPHVFERLYVSKHQPRRAESSSGLGLAIVAELVTAMSGSVEAAVSPVGGARMIVRLPATGA
jgi:two-component system sensor histidine kinase BaeS